MKKNISTALSLSAEFVPVVVKATMRSIEAAALRRDMNDEETAEIVEEAFSCTERFLTALRKEDGYDKLSDEDVDMLRESIHDEVMEGIWMLMQKIINEMKIEVYGGTDRDKTFREDVC